MKARNLVGVRRWRRHWPARCCLAVAARGRRTRGAAEASTRTRPKRTARCGVRVPRGRDRRAARRHGERAGHLPSHGARAARSADRAPRRRAGDPQRAISARRWIAPRCCWSSSPNPRSRARSSRRCVGSTRATSRKAQAHARGDCSKKSRNRAPMLMQHGAPVRASSRDKAAVLQATRKIVARLRAHAEAHYAIGVAAFIANDDALALAEADARARDAGPAGTHGRDPQGAGAAAQPRRTR